MGSTSWYTSIAADAYGRAHISYYDETNRDLKYATNASGTWVATTVDAAGDVGWYTSIALDASRNAHISYYDYTNRDLKYATNASGAWVTSTVDAGGDVGRYTSIALDASRKAHITYYDYTNRDLKYATNASGSWVTTTVDTAGDVGRWTSIALGAYGRAHISYFDSTDFDLKYATNASGAWIVETACDRFLGCGSYSSIALDPDGVAFISHSGEDGSLLLTASCVDEDRDGYGAPGSSHCPEPEPDCDDSDPEVNPGAREGPYRDPTCSDTLDNDCDTLVDGADTGCLQCTSPAQCNDGNPCTDDNCVGGYCTNTNNTNPCDDGESCTEGDVCSGGQCRGFPLDADDDTYVSEACGGNDCNDANPQVNPGASEGPHGASVCRDNIDNDCDGAVDEDDSGCQPACVDNDRDGYGNPASLACPYPQLDCDDSNPNINPGRTEVPGNGLDDDCDGTVDESCFVATAAFGSELEPGIEILRAFRDRYLATNPSGDTFLRAYYEYGRPAAEYIAGRPWLKALVRVLLLPVIGLACLLV